ncbi:Glutathione peroxidase [Methylophaga frappieri]|uniref:Glutathione peroxidase n=1 Tax=Methylophaga frappieri (strain ATCC BAA-2434 / DSM 25690 / JAM7) TaxID=754477 RepID=I1YER4_METFJ|nr:glutathione peroxidase [Methylophaga frappieri]AFJ01407.1 Glutathione peroxidase [Methylophaga frappieri]
MQYILALVMSLMSLSVSAESDKVCPEFLDYELPRLHSNETVNLCDIAAGKPLMIVNTASHCGFTRQFEGLEAVHQKYQDKGLVVVGFASNDFNQEAKSEAEAERICRENFGVTFTMIAPSYVTGDRANPIFQEINKQTREPGWNFNKYLITPQGRVSAAFPSKIEPDSETVSDAIASLLR